MLMWLVTLILAAMLPLVAHAQAPSVSLAPVPVQRFYDNNNIPLSGGQLFVYQAGTNTKAVTYTSASGATPNTNPIIMNARGEPQNSSGASIGVWMPTGNFKFVLALPNDSDPPTSPIWTVDNVSVGIPQPSSATYNPFLYGYGINATITCSIGNLPVTTLCPVNGALSNDPSSAAWYPSTDMAGDVVFLSGTAPWMANVAGTIAGNVFTPSAPLSAAQIAKLRVSQVLHTNSDSPACDGIISGFSPTGVNVTVQGWFTEGFTAGHTPPCTPASSNIVTNRFTKLYARNTVVQRGVNDQEKATIGHEIDVSNNSGINDTCYAYQIGNCGFVNSDGGLDIVPTGTNTNSFGIQIRGASWVAEQAMTGGATFGEIIQPSTGGSLNEAIRIEGNIGPIGIGLSLIDTVTDAIRVWDHLGNISYEQKQGGAAYFGNQTGTANNPTLNFYSSASGNTHPDVAVTFSSGTGNLDGVMAISAGAVDFSNTLFVAGTFKVTQITPPDTSTCAPGTMANDANFVYVCATTNSWKRAALSSY